MSSDIVTALTGTAQSLWNEPQSSLLTGILFGTQAKLPADLSAALRITGTLHVVAVSGQNMSILAGFVGKLSQILGWRLSLVVQGLGICGYIFLVGGSASVVRSGAMALIALFAQVTGRQADAGRALLAAGAIMILLHPDYLTDIGWQLSVLATAGIIWLEPLLEKRLTFLPNMVAGPLAISLSAQLFTWPIIAANFQSLSLISLPANVLVEWAVPWIMALGSLAVLISNVIGLLGTLLAWLTWVPLSYFLGVVELLSKTPGASLGVTYLPPGLALMYYAVILGGIWRWSARGRS